MSFTTFRKPRKMVTLGLQLAAVGCLTAACGSDPVGPMTAEQIEATQAAIKAALGNVETDVEQMRFELYPCPTAASPDADKDGVPDGVPAAQSLTSPMGPGFLPDGLVRFEDKPLDKTARGSQHAYSDGLFVVLADTCYVVRSTPLTKEGAASRDCFPAAKTIGPVPAGKTKEVVILNQCKGTPKAVVDAVAALNHPPELVNLTFEQNGKRATKFTEDCKTLRICGSVIDPDRDPLAWSLVQVGPDGAPVTPQQLVAAPVGGYPQERKDGTQVNCWDVKAPEGAMSYDLMLQVKDQVWDSVSVPGSPQLVAIEDFIAKFQHETRRSRAEQTFPAHVVECQDCTKGVDVVFTMDTSGSMSDEAQALCDDISAVQGKLAASGINATVHLLGLTQLVGGPFSCLTNSVAGLLGTNVPGNAGTCGPTLQTDESWGQSTAIVAERFPWKNSVKVIVPLSDEASCQGNPCNDPGPDRDSVTNAIDRAASHGVIVSPLMGTGTDACTSKLASDLAIGTGGASFSSADPKLDLAKHVEAIVRAACSAR